MRNLFYLLVASLSFAMVGCVEDIPESEIVDSSSEQLPELTAGFAEEQTKTYVESGKYLRWHEGDLITAFFGRTLNNKFMFEGKTGDNSGSFAHIPSGKLETGNAIDAIYAVYPYNAESKFIEGGKIKLYLPVEQEYAPESFGKGANTMVAATENTEDTYLAFKNVCGFLKLGFTGSNVIKSIKVQGNNNEQLAGEAYAVPVFAGKPSMEMGEETVDYVTVVCGEGVEMTEEPTEFWVVLPEVTFEKGITITVTTADGAKYVKTTGKKIVIERNTVQPMAALSLPSDFCAEGSNIVEYTAPAMIELPSNPFNAKVTLHTYDVQSHKGVIVCDEPIVTVKSNAFSSSSLRNITLPNTVAELENGAFKWCLDLSAVYYKSMTPPSLGEDVFWANAKEITLLHFVQPEALENFKNQWVNTILFPYNFDEGYPDIPENEFWYVSDRQLSYDDTKFGSVSIASSEYNSSSRIGVLRFNEKLTQISSSAFNYSKFDVVILPNGLKSLNDSFYRAEVMQVYLPETLTSVSKPFSSGSPKEMVGKHVSTDGRCLIVGGTLCDFASYDITGEYVIPYGVTSIGADAMLGTELTGLILPETLTSIAYRGLYSNKFTDLVIPDSVTYIGELAFGSCTITNLTLGASVNTICRHAFSSNQTGSLITNIYLRSTTPPQPYKGIYSDWCLFGEPNSYIPESTTIYVPKGLLQTYKLDPEWGRYHTLMNEYEM